MTFMAMAAVWFGAMGTLVGWAGDAKPAADQGVRIAITKLDHTAVAGRVTDHDGAGFTLTDLKGATQTIKWAELSPKAVADVLDAVLAKGTGEDWLAAGKVLARLPNGKFQATRAFAKAQKLDPTLKPRIDEAKKDPSAGSGEAAATSAGVKGGPAAPDGMGDATAPRGPMGGGAVEAARWGKATDADQAAAVAELKALRLRKQEREGGGIKPHRDKVLSLLFRPLLKRGDELVGPARPHVRALGGTVQRPRRPEHLAR